ncbi:hypothetical protein ABW21_db0206166 [Orbilia brochopaga]|nr:hypothetical protein ABW21_db0206166 [Drechslerella brochopaga]
MAYRRNNVSQFQANLNLINPIYGAAEPSEETFDPGNLELFSNADFFDWDMGQSIHSAIGPETDREVEKKMESSSAVDIFEGDSLEGKSLVFPASLPWRGERLQDCRWPTGYACPGPPTCMHLSLRPTACSHSGLAAGRSVAVAVAVCPIELERALTFASRYHNMSPVHPAGLIAQMHIPSILSPIHPSSTSY